MLSVQTNTTALSVQRFLNKSAQAQSSAQGKAASGSNIVRAADDAAGLAISNKMKADIASLRQGGKNASQGASLLQIANGATDRTVDILTRLKELSSNNDLLAAEKKFKQAEVQQLLEQLDAIAVQTTVSGRAILNGADKALKGPQTATITNTTGFIAGSVFGVNAAGITTIAGNIVGTVTDARVALSGTNVVAEIDIDGRTFRALPVSATAAAGAQTLTFIDTTNAQNRFSFTTGSGPTLPANVAASQNGLRTSLGVGSALPTKFSEQARSTTVVSGLSVGSTLDTTNSAVDFTVNSLQGGVNGTYKKANVLEIAGNYTVSLDIGNETYVGRIAVGAAANTTFTLTSTINDNNKFVLQVATGNTVPAAGNAVAFTTALDTLFRKSATDGSVVSLTGGAAAETVGAALLKAGAATYADVVRTSSATKADTYTLTTKFVGGSSVSGVAEKIIFRLQGSDGSVSEAEIKDENNNVTDNVIIDPSVTKARTLQFGNGITLNLDTASINNMVNAPIGSADDKAIRFTVGNGESTILQFQTGIASTDMLSIGFDAVNVKSLGLTGINMETNAKAAEAVDKIDAALARVNLLTANIGALQSRLDFTQDINATSMEHYQGANSVIRDADLSAVLTDLSQATLRNNVATAILSQANQTPTQSVSRLLQGL
ncbi:MAG: flagellin [Holosporales bacterium]|jgi:flagellin